VTEGTGIMFGNGLPPGSVVRTMPPRSRHETSCPRAPWCGLSLALLLGCLCLAAQKPPRTGPATERRLPALKVPPGFRATLFACDPLIEYPSATRAGAAPRLPLRGPWTT